MSSEPSRYPRREFLGTCIAGSLVAPLVANRTCSASAPNQDDVEALLEHTDQEAVYRRVSLPDERNAWPVLMKAKESLAPLDNLFEGDSEITLWDEASILRPLPADDRDQQLRRILNDHRAALQRIDEAIGKAELQYPH